MNRRAQTHPIMSRRRFLTVSAAGVGAAALLAACGTEEPAEPAEGGGATGGGFPVTVEDTFGQVTVEAAPTRVLSLGRTDHDVLLALGIVPVGVFRFVPTMERGVGVWAEDRLGDTTPEFFRPPFNFELVGQLEPDLIVNVQSSGDDAEHETLVGYGTTVGLAKGCEPNQVPWQTSTELISRAVGKGDEGAELVSQTRAALDAVGRDNPGFAGKTVSILLAYSGKVGIYTVNDTRMQVVTAWGLTPSPYVESLGKDDYFVEMSPERMADADADVVIVLSQQGSPRDDVMSEYPQIERMAANAEGRMVFPEDPNIGLALSAASVLSIPYVVDGLVPLVAETLA
ncbi:ABC transporter substrate-binding protein [Actinophytocola xinjiangensis]|uniref:ABC transporter substrate-binding protein n=1 Tax=Actinophytocola xinjiangensis TaxID=485602 RepID=UPI000A58C1EA|nr:ABC transporter substrate-binding protein [Actinophytocola xinjiangensis]